MESATTRQTNVLTWVKDTLSLSIVTAIFLLWGLLTYLHGLLQETLRQTVHNTDPSLADTTGMTIGQAQALTFVFFGAYFLLSYPAGKIIRIVGYKSGMVMGLSVAAIGCIMIIPATFLESYNLIFVAVVVLAGGITLLQVAANPYVLFISKPKTSASRLTFVQGFNSLGAFGALALFAFNENLSTDSMAAIHCNDSDLVFSLLRQASFLNLILPYLIIAALFVIAAIVLTLSNLPEASAVHLEGEIDEMQKKTALQYPHLVFGALAIFAYVGAEIAIAGNLRAYHSEILKAIEYKNGSVGISSLTVLYVFLGGAVVGRFLGAYVLKKIEPHDLLTYCAIGALGSVFIAISFHNEISLYALAFLGLFNSIMFPVIFSLGVRGLGRHSEEGSSILIMAISGGALIPFFFNFLHDARAEISDIVSDEFHHTNFDRSLWVVFTCYMVVVFFGLFGYRFKRADSVHHD